jgi:hypothetical protein
MIRFSYDTPEDTELPFEHFSIEGDNERGYVLLAWSMTPPPEGDEPAMMQQWFELLGEALDHCANEFCIMRDDWHAPTVEPPISNFARPDRGRRKSDPTVLNPDNFKRHDKE